MRSKEEANDYRYFPDPDLLPVSISKKLIKEIKNNMPELPENKKERFMSQYGLSDYDTSILIADRELSEFFEEVLNKKELSPKLTANWIITEMLALAKKSSLDVRNYPVTSEDLAILLTYVRMKLFLINKQKKYLSECG